MSAHGKDREEEEDEEALSEEEAVRKAASTSTLKNSARPQQVIGHIPEVVDDFLRNFLRRAGLIQTSGVFEAEWTENLQRGPEMSFIPDALTHRQLLQSELEAVCRETDTLRREALEAGERTVAMQRETDLYRLQCRRAAEDKKELTDDIKQLKKHLESYEPALRQLDEKYKAALSQKMLISLEKDKGRYSPESRLKQENLQIKKETCIGASSSSSSSSRASARRLVKRHPQDSESPCAASR